MVFFNQQNGLYIMYTLQFGEYVSIKYWEWSVDMVFKFD